MIDIALLSPMVPASSPADLIPSTTTSTNTTATVLARSRRPAILTYASAIVDTASTLSGIPWYIMGWKTESEVLEVTMFEGVEFSKGWKNIPDMVKVVVEADEKMQFYNVGVKILARFGGLRYNIPIPDPSLEALLNPYSLVTSSTTTVSSPMFSSRQPSTFSPSSPPSLPTSSSHPSSLPAPPPPLTRKPNRHNLL